MVRVTSHKRQSDINVAIERSVTEVLGDVNDYIAEVIFTRWHTAFVQKAMGGTDEFGESWPPLSQERIDYKESRAMSQDINWQAEWNKRQVQIYSQLRANGMNQKDARAKSITMAWGSAATGGSQINMFTTRLEASISPDGHPDQIREVTKHGIRAGTRVPYAPYVNAQRRINPTAKEISTWVMDAAKATGARLTRVLRNKV